MDRITVEGAPSQSTIATTMLQSSLRQNVCIRIAHHQNDSLYDMEYIRESNEQIQEHHELSEYEAM